MLQLVRVHDWCEPPETGGLHLSTLVQQVLSLTAQHGGVYPHQAESVLCSRGPFAVDAPTFARLLDAMHDADLLMSSSDGLLLAGPRGEREIEGWAFFAAFESPEVFRVLAQGQEIGTIDAGSALVPGSGLVLGGRRWRVIAVHENASEVEVVADVAGTAPRFPVTGSARVHDRVREEMHALYLSDVVPDYLDEPAKTLLAEGRSMFAKLELHERDLVGWGRETMIFPWRGDRVLDTLRVALHHAGVEADREGVAVVAKASEETVRRVLDRLATSTPPDPLDLAATVPDKREEKWDGVLSGRLLDEAYAARALDVDGTWAWLRSRGTRSAAAPVPIGVLGCSVVDVPTLEVPEADVATGPRIKLGSTPFAVIDVETTGLAVGRGHRIVEIAVVRCRADGSVEDFWHTLLDPGRDVGPTRVHGLSMVDVIGAPSFADVAGEVAARLEGRVLVAHNVPFDLGFLRAEFARAGHVLPEIPTLCTLALTGSRLADACAAHGIALENAHSAREDALATASLLQSQLRGTDFAELGVRVLNLPSDWPSISTTGRAQPRSLPAPRLADDAVDWGSAGELAYADALRWVLEDGEIDSLEVDHLLGVAREWSLSSPTVEGIRERLVGDDVAAQARDRLAVVERALRTVAEPARAAASVKEA